MEKEASRGMDEGVKKLEGRRESERSRHRKKGVTGSFRKRKRGEVRIERKCEKGGGSKGEKEGVRKRKREKGTALGRK